MQSIVSYFNTFLELIFGSNQGVPTIQLLSPTSLITSLMTIFLDSRSEGLWFFICRIFQSSICFSIIFSSFVWVWFAILTFKLLLTYPFNWIRSIIRRCSGR